MRALAHHLSSILRLAGLAALLAGGVAFAQAGPSRNPAGVVVLVDGTANVTSEGGTARALEGERESAGKEIRGLRHDENKRYREELKKDRDRAPPAQPTEPAKP